MAATLPSSFAGVRGTAASVVARLADASADAIADALSVQPYEFFYQLKDLDEAIAREFYKTFAPRWTRSEERIKEVENALGELKFDDMSMEEGRFEILCELLDKACQAFEVFDEHEKKRIPHGHRLVLEARLLAMINDSFDQIEAICRNFDRLRGDKHAIDNERDMLRMEIRLCDLRLSEIHERFLKSYLEMNW